jgi:hypothetical protein
MDEVGVMLLYSHRIYRIEFGDGVRQKASVEWSNLSLLVHLAKAESNEVAM